MEDLLTRITIDPAICHGKPCVRGLRYPVEMLLELLSSGMTTEDILVDYKDLEREDLLRSIDVRHPAEPDQAAPVGGTMKFLVDMLSFRAA